MASHYIYYFTKISFIYTNYKLALFGKIIFMPTWRVMNVEVFIMKREVLWDMRF